MPSYIADDESEYLAELSGTYSIDEANKVATFGSDGQADTAIVFPSDSAWLLIEVYDVEDVSGDIGYQRYTPNVTNIPFLLTHARSVALAEYTNFKVVATHYKGDGTADIYTGDESTAITLTSGGISFTPSGSSWKLTNETIAPIIHEVPPEITGTTYYVSSSLGSDSNDGLSISTPWATIDKVNATAFSAGDGVLFKRGDTWQVTSTSNYLYPKSGTTNSYIVYGAYGIGAKPILTPKIDKNSTSDWTEISINKWQTTMPTTEKRLSQVILDGEASPLLVYNNDIASLSAQGYHCHNETTGVTTIYSVGNPATYYTTIEVSPRLETVRMTNRSWFIIDGLHLTNAHFGIIGENNSNVKIRNNKISWIGGSIYAGSARRYGNGIEIWGTHSNVEVYNNEIYQCYDAGVTSQYSSTTGGTSIMQNITYRHNLIYRCGTNIEYFNKSTGLATTTNMKFDNNVLFDAGGWSMNQSGREAYAWGSNVIMWSYTTGQTADPNGLYFRNNIMWKVYGTREDFYNSGWSAEKRALITVTNNTYTKASTFFPDASNLVGDPLFTSEVTPDFHVTTGSNAIGNGLDLEYTLDYEKNTIVIPCNIGIYDIPKS